MSATVALVLNWSRTPFLANADAAGIVRGARVPIILTSRADNVRARMASCAVAALYAHARRAAAAEIGKLAD
jgi:phosphate acetyltransferase